MKDDARDRHATSTVNPTFAHARYGATGSMRRSKTVEIAARVRRQPPLAFTFPTISDMNVCANYFLCNFVC